MEEWEFDPLKAWIETLSEAVKIKVAEYPPDRIYRYGNYVVRLYSYDENAAGECETCTIWVVGIDNPNVILERKVFGVPFNDLTMLPENSQEKGTGY